MPTREPRVSKRPNITLPMGNKKWWHFSISGVVQGVGFRPAVYRAAEAMGATGWVANTTAGVEITAFLHSPDIFMERVKGELPPFANITRCVWERCPEPEGVTTGEFTIRRSRDAVDAEATDVSPDVAICPDCLKDILTPGRRYHYPLTNCTNCGPRYSIVRSLPYDRPLTAMNPFSLCERCRTEYDSPSDRRFHAQPVACSDCGPHYSVSLPDGEQFSGSIDRILDIAAKALLRGEIVMLKGVGGFNLLCDATSAAAVSTLRRMKSRPRKPFVVMVPNIAEAERMVKLSEAERNTLTGWRAPIVVATQRDDSAVRLAAEVTPGCNTLGVILPYMGFHHLLFRHTPLPPLVLTSANHQGRPIIIDDNEARDLASANRLIMISYNRDILNREDDSVVRIGADGASLLLRRARGYVPQPVHLPFLTDGIVAFGADITSAGCVGRGHDAIQGPYVGSLRQGEGGEELDESVRSLLRIFKVKPRIAVVDRHPCYESRRPAMKIGAERIVEMWHHHAHAVSVMADRALLEAGPQLTLVLDGTGYGPDGGIHGAELIFGDAIGFETVAHGEALPLPGGDAAARQPWRMAVSVAVELLGGVDKLPPHFLAELGEEKLRIVARMVERRINSPLSRGAGRLWDAVAALLDLTMENLYEAEAPMLLENLAAMSSDESAYPVDETDPLSARPLFLGIISDIAQGERKEDIARRFHTTYALMWSRIVTAEAARLGCNKLLASGGVMQNLLFVKLLSKYIAPLPLLLPRNTPVNDGGIALGQLAHAAALSLAERSDGALPKPL